jgi:hypothetical protein
MEKVSPFFLKVIIQLNSDFYGSVNAIILTLFHPSSCHPQGGVISKRNC